VYVSNSRCSVNPFVIAWPVNDADVVLAIKAAQTCLLPFSVISGGHGAAGYELSLNGFTLSMSSMAKVEVDMNEHQLTLQPGARFQAVYEAVSEVTDVYIPVGGGCPQVAPGGYYLGGGWSFLSRTYGLGIDTIVSMKTILASGEIMHLNKTDLCAGICADLWWAHRGGGGGNFGVVTELVTELKPIDPEILIGQLCFPQDVAELGSIWQWLLDAYDSFPDYLQIDPGWLPLGENSTRLFCYTVICNHDNETECYDLIEPMVSRKDVVYNTLAMMPYVTWQLEHGSLTAAQSGQLYLTNFMMDQNVISAEIMRKLQVEILTAPSYRNIVIFHMGGGNITAVGKEESAFYYREQQFVIQIKAIWNDETPENEQLNVAWVENIKSWLQPLAAGSYVNYIDPYLSDYEIMYYSNNYPRLQSIKTAVDPGDFFLFNESIKLL
jgi:hypothetical protein